MSGVAASTAATAAAAAASSSASAPAAAHQHLVFEVFGKVQKVFFRKFTATKATELNLRGYCLNTPAGTVQGEAVGHPQAIERFKKWLREEGSPNSKITEAKFQVKEAPAEHGFKKFEVRR